MQLTKIINTMQDIAHEGKALYDVVIYAEGKVIKPKHIYAIPEGKIVIETEVYDERID